MALTLDQLIAQLIATRDANPSLADTVVTMEDQELGSPYVTDVTSVEADQQGVMLSFRERR